MSVSRIFTISVCWSFAFLKIKRHQLVKTDRSSLLSFFRQVLSQLEGIIPKHEDVAGNQEKCIGRENLVLTKTRIFTLQI